MLMHRTPQRMAISLLRPLGMSDFLYLFPSQAVSPTHFLRLLSCGVAAVPPAPSPSVLQSWSPHPTPTPAPLPQVLVVKPSWNETVMAQRIVQEKVKSQSRVRKHSTGVRVSHPTVWLLTLDCGLSCMSQGSGLDWPVPSVSSASQHLSFWWTSNP